MSNKREDFRRSQEEKVFFPISENSLKNIVDVVFTMSEANFTREYAKSRIAEIAKESFTDDALMEAKIIAKRWIQNN